MLKKAVIALIFSLLVVSTVEAISLVSVKGENVNMRSGPGSNYSVICSTG